MTLKDILVVLGADFTRPISVSDNPYGRGLILHRGFQVKCAGKMGPNPRFEEDTAAGLDPPAEILVQHLIGTLTDVPKDGKEAGVVPSERSDEATFTLDSEQEGIDASAPVCQICGQPPVL